MKKGNLTLEELERYWGSLEAYNEEQRRTGLVEMEGQWLSVSPDRWVRVRGSRINKLLGAIKINREEKRARSTSQLP